MDIVRFCSSEDFDFSGEYEARVEKEGGAFFVVVCWGVVEARKWVGVEPLALDFKVELVVRGPSVIGILRWY